jgi:radical SAM superfamily enzyme YgiQ (UPF0313 family)
MHYVIIDPTSTEFNRGSFCYAPYLLYNGLSEYIQTGDKISFFETFQSEDIDKLPTDADAYFVCLWSYPQVEICMLLNHFIPMLTENENVFFVGYNGLIKQYGFSHIKQFMGFDPMQDNSFLKSAMQNYPKYYSHFRRLLLSDCDMHLKSKDVSDKVYPLFTTYGCPNNCAFCPSTVNCGYRRFELSEEETFKLLKECWEVGVRYIHFTDEDLFFNIDRAANILNYLISKKYTFKMIALASAEKLSSFIKKYECGLLIEAGVELVEVGMESADENLAKKMGRVKVVGTCVELAEIQQNTDLNIFWLTQTFFPGETIHSLNETGKFLKKYGYKIDEVVGRLRTNGTKGGLGQFFQPYHGTAIYKTLSKKGIMLTERPVRLLPSFVPYSFLTSVICAINYSNSEAANKWLKLYNVYQLEIIPTEGKTIEQHIPAGVAVSLQIKYYIYFAILARMGVINADI